MNKLLLPEGARVLLLGNEAIARGALEAGIESEIIEKLLKIASKLNLYVE